jgi:hypothetical protein
VEIPVTSPGHIESLADSRHLTISSQVAGSGLPTALDAGGILRQSGYADNGTKVIGHNKIAERLTEIRLL